MTEATMQAEIDACLKETKKALLLLHTEDEAEEIVFCMKQSIYDYLADNPIISIDAFKEYLEKQKADTLDYDIYQVEPKELRDKLDETKHRTKIVKKAAIIILILAFIVSLIYITLFFIGYHNAQKAIPAYYIEEIE